MGEQQMQKSEQLKERNDNKPTRYPGTPWLSDGPVEPEGMTQK
jgi:hypothetical protein